MTTSPVPRLKLAGIIKTEAIYRGKSIILNFPPQARWNHQDRSLTALELCERWHVRLKLAGIIKTEAFARVDIGYKV